MRVKPATWRWRLWGISALEYSRLPMKAYRVPAAGHAKHHFAAYICCDCTEAWADQMHYYFGDHLKAV